MSKIIVPGDARLFPIDVQYEDGTVLRKQVRKGLTTTDGRTVFVTERGEVFVEGPIRLRQVPAPELEDKPEPPAETPALAPRSPLSEAALLYDGGNVVRTHER